MLTRFEQTQKEWGGLHPAIDNWLAERGELLVLFFQLAALPHNDKSDRVIPDAAKTQGFCQLLVDYLSAGHFEIYDDLVRQCEQCGEDVLNQAKRLYPQIAESTDTALQFNDKYAEVSNLEMLTGFDADLSELGQILEQRFELEDELLHNLLTAKSCAGA